MSRKNNLSKRKAQNEFDKRRASQRTRAARWLLCALCSQSHAPATQTPHRAGEEELKAKQEAKRLRKNLNAEARREEAQTAAAKQVRAWRAAAASCARAALAAWT